MQNIVEINGVKFVVEEKEYRPNKLAAIVLLIMFGNIGAHAFYAGRPIIGAMNITLTALSIHAFVVRWNETVPAIGIEFWHYFFTLISFQFAQFVWILSGSFCKTRKVVTQKPM